MNNTFSIILCALFLYTIRSDAFSNEAPSFVQEGMSYSVSSVQPDSSNSSNNTIKTHRKQQVPFETTSTAAAEVTLSDGLTLINTDPNNEVYYVDAIIDSEIYPLMIDTGSPYLWIYNGNCTDSSCLNKQLYNGSQSHTYATQTFELSYSTGSASGIVTSNNITLAGLTLKNFQFGAASEVPDIFSVYNFSGVLGLPNSNQASSSMLNPAEGFKIQGTTNASKFALCLGEYNSTYTNAGIIGFGADFEQLHDGQLYYSQAISNAGAHWETLINNIYVNDAQVEFDSVQVNGANSTIQRMALLDSGTTAIVSSSNDATKLHSLFPGALTDGSDYAILCNSTSLIKLNIGGQNWTLSPTEYLGKKYADDSKYAGYCASNIQGMEGFDDGTWVLGAIFLKTVYVEFNIDESTIGIANRSSGIKLVASNTSSSDYYGTFSQSSILNSSSKTNKSSSASSSSSASGFNIHHSSPSLYTLLFVVLSLLLQ
ncbi:unnamed protein product [Ambrosiozyma monospora]|uniref:Unnamed protein product n=1 Tax=Ambrosiozyma monospora TaxID=43982 RepID=A0A9W7DGK0_AMBMO|nr:unnamed protein product [Ambrosiozyma monospora]